MSDLNVPFNICLVLLQGCEAVVAEAAEKHAARRRGAHGGSCGDTAADSDETWSQPLQQQQSPSPSRNAAVRFHPHRCQSGCCK